MPLPSFMEDKAPVKGRIIFFCTTLVGGSGGFLWLLGNFFKTLSLMKDDEDSLFLGYWLFF